MTKPILVFGYGNLSRGDDAVGPLLLEHLQQNVDLSEVDLLTDFQLQIEHLLDLQQRQLVIFVDAAVTELVPFSFTPIEACQDRSYSSHAMSPAALLQVYQTVTGKPAPLSYLLAIKAESFELGEPLMPLTNENLEQACAFMEQLLQQPLEEILSQYG